MTVLNRINQDVDFFLNDFGETQTWTSAEEGADPIQFVGTFDNDYAEVNLQTGTVGPPKPAMLCKRSSASSMARGDTVTVTSILYGLTSVAYKIEDVKHNPPDEGPGFSRIILKK